jgi:hypothetical protein
VPGLRIRIGPVEGSSAVREIISVVLVLFGLAGAAWAAALISVVFFLFFCCLLIAGIGALLGMRRAEPRQEVRHAEPVVIEHG